MQIVLLRTEVSGWQAHACSLTSPKIDNMDKLCSAGEHGAWTVRSNHRPILGEEEHDALVAWLGDEEGVSEISKSPAPKSEVLLYDTT